MHGVLSHTKNKIWGEEKNWGNPPAPRGIDFLRFFLKNSQNWLKWQERFYPHPPPSDMCAEKIPLVSIGGRAEGQACTDPGARTPIGASEILFLYLGGSSWSIIGQ